MNFRIALLLIVLITFSRCKSDSKSTIAKENPTAPAYGENDPAPATQDDEQKNDLGELMGTMDDLLKDTTKDASDQSLLTIHGELNTDFIKSEAGKRQLKAHSQMYGVSEKEVQFLWVLEPNITSVKHAEALERSLLDEKLENYLSSGEASPKFQELMEKNRIRIKKQTALFKRLALKAKQRFYKANPSWFALDEANEDTFRDSRNKMVYLPLGNLSFADSVVAFKPGKPEGRAPKKSLGPPPRRKAKVLTDCTSLGIGGELTLFFNDNAIVDVNGPDIYVFEIGTIEPTNLEISKNGKDWIIVGRIKGGTASVDIADYVKPGETFNYVRFTDLHTRSSVPGADIDAVAAIGGAMRMNLDSAVLFDTGSHILKEEGILAIKELALQMKNINRGTIRVEGHTDDVGDDKSNQELSTRRAASVAAELKKMISSPKFNWKEKGHGESQPIVLNDSDKNRAKNRRVEILVTPY
jgi:outer membrane protein OmpA-like peptidoglycan-associated protein